MNTYIIAKLIFSDFVIASSSFMIYDMLKHNSTNSKNKMVMNMLVKIAFICVLLFPVLLIALIWVY